MDLLAALFSPAELPVGPTWQERQQAPAALLRIDDVHHLFRAPTVSDLLSNSTAAERVSQWLQERLAARALCYHRDPARRDIWQSARRTLTRGAGDCEDLAILVLAMLLHENVSAHLVIGRVGVTAHAWVEGNDRNGPFLLEATTGRLDRGRTTLLSLTPQRPPPYLAQAALTTQTYQVIG